MRDKNGFVIQNIPVRTEEGRKLRDAMREKNQPLLSADYSALELRVLAQLGVIPRG